MFPFRTSSIFRSRWMALLWAAGIIWTAVDVADSSPRDDGTNKATTAQTDATGASYTDADAKKLQSIIDSL